MAFEIIGSEKGMQKMMYCFEIKQLVYANTAKKID